MKLKALKSSVKTTLRERSVASESDIWVCMGGGWCVGESMNQNNIFFGITLVFFHHQNFCVIIFFNFFKLFFLCRLL